MLGDDIFDPSGRLHCFNRRTHTTAGEADLLLQDLKGLS